MATSVWLDASISVSHSRWRNIQADFIDSSGFPTTANIGDGRITSLSGALAMRPTSALTFELGAVYNHSRVDDLSPQILPVFAAAPARLGRIPNVASHAVRGSVNYATMIGDEDFRVNGWANYIGPSRLGIGPVLGESQGDYVDTGLAMRVGNNRRGLSLTLTNLFDSRGNRFSLGTPFLEGNEGFLTPLRPRTLRIAVECHSCFDWLMPAMDALREGWPDVEMDIVSGFHPDPVGLLDENRADLVIVSTAKRRRGVEHHPLFEYDMPALLAPGHPLLEKPYLTAKDFSLETLITYPIPDNRMDLFRQVLEPSGVEPKERRTTELTVAILQLVKSRRGIAALPRWAVQPYLENDYVAEMPITAKGLRASLHAATTKEGAGQAFMKEFIETVRVTAEGQFEGIRLL